MGFQRLVLGTAVAALLSLGVLVGVGRSPVALPRMPMQGRADARHEIVLVEEPTCTACRLFYETVYPRLSAEYVATGRAKMKLLLVSFLDGSRPMANAALAVGRDAPEQFFAYLGGLYRMRGEVTSEQLVELARTVGNIPLPALEACIKSECMGAQLDYNIRAAESLMGADYGTPAVYLNGKRVEPLTYSQLTGSMQ